jgi:hypothetical protein
MRQEVQAEAAAFSLYSWLGDEARTEPQAG